VKYKATIPGTENVLIGDYWNEGAKVLSVPLPDGRDWTVSFRKSDGWKVEPIIELPTNRYAVVRVDGTVYWRGESNDPRYVWSDNDGGDWWSHQEIALKAFAADRFDILFEGIAPEGAGL
jgi:hypothetical protein